MTLSAIAQLTVTSAWAPTAGIHTRVFALNATMGLSEGSSGANQTWNITSYDTTSSQTVVYIAPSSAPS